MNGYQLANSGYVPISADNCNDHISKILENKLTINDKLFQLTFFPDDLFQQKHLRYAAMITKGNTAGAKKLLKYLVEKGLDPSDAIDFSSGPIVAHSLIKLGADPSEMSFFGKIPYGENLSGKGFRRYYNLLRIFTVRIILGGKLPCRVQDWYDEAYVDEKVDVVLRKYIDNYELQICKDAYYSQYVKEYGCVTGVGYTFVERLYNYITFRHLVMQLKRSIKEGEVVKSGVKRSKVAVHPLSMFLQMEAPPNITEYVIGFLGFHVTV